MRAESGVKGDVAAGLEGLRNCEGVRRLGAVLGRQGVQSPPNSNEFLGLERAVDQPVAPSGRAADGPLELALREYFLAQALFEKMFGQCLHGYIIPDTSKICKFTELYV